MQVPLHMSYPQKRNKPVILLLSFIKGFNTKKLCGTIASPLETGVSKLYSPGKKTSARRRTIPPCPIRRIYIILPMPLLMTYDIYILKLEDLIYRWGLTECTRHRKAWARYY